MAGIFGELSVVSVSQQTKQSTESPQQIDGEYLEETSGENSGWKFEKFGEPFVL